MLPLAWAELAAVPAVEHVHRQPDDQPYEETQPSQDRQAGHQQHTKYHAEDGRRQAAGSAESAVPLRLFAPQNDDSYRDQNKREQRTDIRQIREGANVENAAGNAHQESTDPSCGGRRAKSRMDAAE